MGLATSDQLPSPGSINFPMQGLGYWFMKMNPVLLLSGIAGGRSCTPGLNALREAGGNDVTSLGYPVTYAIANVLLTVWGPVVVAFVHSWRH